MEIDIIPPVIETKLLTMADAMSVAQHTLRAQDPDPDPYGYASEIEHESSIDILPAQWKASPGSPLWIRRLTRRGRMAAIMEMITKGISTREIAKELHVAETTVAEDIHAIRKEWQQSMLADAQQMAAQDLYRLEWLFAKLVPGIERGDTKSINTAVEVIRERGNIVGYRSGVQIDIESYIRQVAESNGYDPDKAVEIASRVSIKLK